MGKQRLTDKELAEARERLGDNFMWPDDEPCDPMVLEAMFDDGVTPETCGGTPEDKVEYAAYYAMRKAKGD